MWRDEKIIQRRELDPAAYASRVVIAKPTYVYLNRQHAAGVPLLEAPFRKLSGGRAYVIGSAPQGLPAKSPR